MSLNNFGSVLDFAIQMEDQNASFLQDALNNSETKDCQDVLERFLSESKKNSKTLSRARQENVTEMILEPIQGLERKSYQAEETDPNQLNKQQILEKIKHRDHKCLAFYEDAAEKLKPVSDVAGTFQRLAKKRRARIEQLESTT